MLDSAAPNPTSHGSIVTLTRDLMFGSRISAAAKLLGYNSRFVRDLPALAAALEATLPPALAVIDMNGPLDWDAVADLVTQTADRTPILGFGPHVDVEGRRAAKRSGLTRILSNGEFHRDTAGWLARYALKASPGAAS